jgi:hypothetical protein
MLPSDGRVSDACLLALRCMRAYSIRCRYMCCAVAPFRVDTLVIFLRLLVCFAIILVYSVFFGR